MSNWRTRIEPVTRPLFFAWSRMTRGKTLGVRGIAVDAGGRVLLVQHTYLHGWWLPGGGVDRGETVEQAVIREMREETGLIVAGRPRLVSVHSNERFFPGDHVAVYRIDAFRLTGHAPNGEIAETGWFAPDALPADTHHASRARLTEVLGGKSSDPDW